MDNIDLFYAMATLETGFYMEKRENNGFFNYCSLRPADADN